MVEIARVPERLENRVREAQDENILRSFFPEKMIDAVGLLFGKRTTHDAIEFARGGEIGAERFLDDDARPTAFACFVQAGAPEMFHDWFELIGRDREIEKSIAARAAFGVDLVQALSQTFVARLIAEVALMVVNRLRKSIPDFVANRLARKFSRRFLEFFSKVTVGFFAPGETDDGDGGWQIAVGREIIKSGNEFAMGQIAGRAEDHDAAWLRNGAGR